LPTKIKLVKSKKFFLADFTPMQPIEPIIKECYRQFKISIPKDLTKARLVHVVDDVYTQLDQTDFNKRFGAYKIPKDGELIFEP